MIELATLKKLPFLPKLDPRTTTYSNVNYTPLNSPGASHRRHLSLSNYASRRTICAAVSILTFLLLAIATYVSRSSAPNPRNGKLLPYEGGTIPLGQSRDRDGREMFWWEQFPMLKGLYNGRKTIVSFEDYTPEQLAPSEHAGITTSVLVPAPGVEYDDRIKCYIDEEQNVEPPQIKAYQGLPQGMSAPFFGSYKELGIQQDLCYDRINRLGPYGLGLSKEQGGFGPIASGDNDGLDHINTIDYKNVSWATVQHKCYEKNKDRLKSRPRTAFIVRTWDTYDYTPYQIIRLRAIISELALATGGEITVHFLIHVRNDSIPIWASHELYEEKLKTSLPPEFRGMGSLWSVAQMKLVYPPPFPPSLNNFSGGKIYEAYRSLHFPLQYFASKHPEYDYFWQWEMDIRVTGHYHELLKQVSQWADKQSRDHLWERSSRFFIPSLHNNSYEDFSAAVVEETSSSGHIPISGPQLPFDQLLPMPSQSENSDSITDLITFNPLFDPTNTRWAFHDDITGYPRDQRPPTRAALITASRMSRRLLLLMHEETYRNKHTMFPEMYPASIALHYGLKAVYAPLPVFFNRAWPAEHANEIFNNAKLSPSSIEAGMVDHGGGHFHGKGGSVFGPGEHVFRGSTYYSNAQFAGYLWRRWLGNENQNGEIAYETEEGHGRMCLPMMVLHPVKHDA